MVAGGTMNLVQGRECGGCVACCKTLEIQDPQIAKPADTLCKHCTGHGCSIYDTRPPTCRDWYCLWRREQNLPDQLRPDQCGVIFSIDGEDRPRTIFESFFVVGRSLENDRSVFDAPAVNAALQVFAQYGTPVFLSWELGTKGLLYPNGPLADAIERPSTTPYGTVVVQALGWRARYGELLRRVGIVPNFLD